MANTTFSGPVTSTAGFIGDITKFQHTQLQPLHPPLMLVLVRLCTFLTVQQAQQSWPSLMAQTGSVLIQVPQSQQRKELGYE